MTQSAKVGSICKFCRHLCDNTQRSQLLVCGMHPYGPAGDDECEDFEQLAPGAPSTSRMLPHQSPTPTHVVTYRLLGGGDLQNLMTRVATVQELVDADQYCFEQGTYVFAPCDRDRQVNINGQDFLLRADHLRRGIMVIPGNPDHRAAAVCNLSGDRIELPSESAHVRPVNCRCTPVPVRPWTDTPLARSRFRALIDLLRSLA